MNEDTIKVRPINQEFILDILNGLATDRQDNEEFIIQVGAMYENVEVDNDCRYRFLDNKFIDGKIQLVLTVGVCVKTKTLTGYSRGIVPQFYFDICLDTEGLLGEEVSLKEFMGSRYNYNPRIRTNMREFIEDIKTQLN